MKKYFILFLLLTVSLFGQGIKLTDTDSITSYKPNYLMPIGEITNGRMDWRNLRLENLQKLINRDVIYPEMYATGIPTDWTSAITKALTVARDSGKAVVFTTPVYTCSSKIIIDLGGKSISLLSYSGSVIYLTNTSSTSVFQTTEANIELYNADEINIEGLSFRGIRNGILPILAQGDGGSSLCNIVLRNSNQVTVNRSSFTQAVFCGCRILDVKKLSFTNSYADSNTYAGLMVQRTGQLTITGNRFSQNGTNTYLYGYGVACSHRYGQPVDNEGINISFNVCVNNTRKGIDAHDGLAGKISYNYVKGWGQDAIGCVNEAGSNPDSSATSVYWTKRVTDLWITDNYVEQDIPWFNTLTNSGGCSGIVAGSYANVSYGNGSIFIHNNIIKNNSVSVQRSPIFIFVNTGGEAIKLISIKDNSIPDCKISSSYTDDAAISLNAGTVDPLYVDITGNYINGESENAIKILAGIFAQVANNHIDGGFATKIYIDPGTEYKLIGNTYQNKALLDVNMNIHETQIGNFFITSDRIEESETKADDGTINLNWHPGTDSTNYYRNVVIWNGRGEQIAFFRGADKLISFTKDVKILNDLYVTRHIQAASFKASNYYSADSTAGSTTTVSGLVYKNGLFTGGSLPQAVTNLGNSKLNFGTDYIYEYTTNATASFSVNYIGYLGGTTQFRDFGVYDGKNNQIAYFRGSDKLSSFTGYVNSILGYKLNGNALTITNLDADLTDFPAQASNSGKYLTTNGTALSWGNAVSSVAMTVPTGLTVTGSPITSSGTLAITLTSGYSIPTTANQTNWSAAYAWGNHASAGYLTSSAIGTTVQAYDADLADLADGSLTATKVQYLTTVTSDVQTQINTKANSSTPSFTGVMTFTGDADIRTGGSVSFNYNSGTDGFYFWGGDGTVDFSSTGGGNLYANGFINAVSGYKVNGTAFNLANWGASSATTVTSFSNVKKRTMTLSDGSTINVLTEN